MARPLMMQGMMRTGAWRHDVGDGPVRASIFAPACACGTTGADFIDAKGGADAVYAKAGDDVVVGGRGEDLLNGGWGNDNFFFGRQHGADKVQDFGHDFGTGNFDVIALDSSIDAYFVFSEAAGIKIVTVDDGLKQGSITLQGVTADQWTSWGGEFGPNAYTGDMGTLIDYGATLIA